MKVSTVIAFNLAGFASASKVPYAGVNIAGCDFGCATNGSCVNPVDRVAQDDCAKDGVAQMQHFAKDDGFNVFRLPVGWQYLLNGQQSGQFYPPVWNKYVSLVEGCLETKAKCIIDVHNYGRWDLNIVGQNMTDKSFVDLWGKLATKWAQNPNVIFGIMNEPHGMDIPCWKKTVEDVVGKIRSVGAKTQSILIPASEYTHTSQWTIDGPKGLIDIKDTDKTTDKLIIEVHQYFDSDNSGRNVDCVNAHKSDFDDLATYLRPLKRKAMLTETGGGNSDSCSILVCQALSEVNKHSDVYLGWTGWAAGGFSSSPSEYNLTETPVGGKDQRIVTDCIKGAWTGSPAPSYGSLGPSYGSSTAPSPSPTYGSPTTPSSTPSSTPGSYSKPYRYVKRRRDDWEALELKKRWFYA